MRLSAFSTAFTGTPPLSAAVNRRRVVSRKPARLTPCPPCAWRLYGTDGSVSAKRGLGTGGYTPVPPCFSTQPVVRLVTCGGCKLRGAGAAGLRTMAPSHFGDCTALSLPGNGRGLGVGIIPFPPRQEKATGEPSPARETLHVLFRRKDTRMFRGACKREEPLTASLNISILVNANI